ncbi:gamma-glutamylcyclotransferase family protein [Allosphingosinicella vermicomposti]|uniref:gamma-glutamylcyclotransferase family protein n=1 Tax=Allosphingosinicella vermicomposti TaxID=614671 RepID=UPI000D113F47|nr:gamma-glutamylcyclotransferase family protein [Allosphingosinicella vermicomposti]
MPSIPLFSYGTLQQENVQLANFGRVLEGRADALVGFRLDAVAVDDPVVIATSGLAVHHIAVATGDPADQVPGTVFQITAEELAASDAYEVDAYIRIKTPLASGGTAFVYVKA